MTSKMSYPTNKYDLDQILARFSTTVFCRNNGEQVRPRPWHYIWPWSSHRSRKLGINRLGLPKSKTFNTAVEQTVMVKFQHCCESPSLCFSLAFPSINITSLYPCKRTLVDFVVKHAQPLKDFAAQNVIFRSSRSANFVKHFATNPEFCQFFAIRK